jgi:hypothetical protein
MAFYLKIVEKEIHKKYQYVIKKNVGFKTLVQILKINSGEVNTMEGVGKDLKVEDLAFFIYTPIYTIHQ